MEYKLKLNDLSHVIFAILLILVYVKISTPKHFSISIINFYNKNWKLATFNVRSA